MLRKIKSNVVAIITLCCLAFAGWSSQTFAAQPDYVEDEVLVLSDKDSDQSTEAAMEAISGAAVQKKITFPRSRLSKKSGSTHDTTRHSILRVKLPKGKTVNQAIAEAKKTLRTDLQSKIRPKLGDARLYADRPAPAVDQVLRLLGEVEQVLGATEEQP